ncbi:MAG: MipA/OmpV family protein, partial [Ktedonobacteraceae bacterium]
DLRYRDIAFVSAIEGIGVNIFRSKTYRIGVALTYDGGRSASDDPHLKGIGRIRPAPVAKVFVDYVIFPVVLRADLRHAIDGAPGLLADAAIYAPLFASDHLIIFSGLSFTWASHASMNAYYGITPAETLASGLHTYNTSAGLRSYGIGSDLTWSFSQHWLINASVSIQSLSGQAYRSPLVQTRIEPAVSLALGYEL